MKINFSKMTLNNLAGKPFLNVCETISDTIRALGPTPKWRALAEKISQKQDVEITGLDKDEIIGFLKDERIGLLPFRAREVEDFIDNYGKTTETKDK